MKNIKKVIYNYYRNILTVETETGIYDYPNISEDEYKSLLVGNIEDNINEMLSKKS